MGLSPAGNGCRLRSTNHPIGPLHHTAGDQQLPTQHTANPAATGRQRDGSRQRETHGDVRAGKDFQSTPKRPRRWSLRVMCEQRLGSLGLPGPGEAEGPAASHGAAPISALWGWGTTAPHRAGHGTARLSSQRSGTAPSCQGSGQRCDPPGWGRGWGRGCCAGAAGPGCAVPCCAVPCRAVPCRAVPCCAVPCRAVPCRAVLCRAVLCRAVLCRSLGPSRLRGGANPARSRLVPRGNSNPRPPPQPMGPRRRPPPANGSAPWGGAGRRCGAAVTLGAAVAMAPERGARPSPPGPSAGGTEGLPRAFLQSLRTLFDILDDRRRGYVHLQEIESRWQGAEARELPAGVLDGLRRAAPPSGYLTFERFVLGLRAALPGTDGGAPGKGRAPGRGEPRDKERGRSNGSNAVSSARSLEKLPSPHGNEERRGQSGGHREQEPGQGLPRGRGIDVKSAGQSQGDGGHVGPGDIRRHQRGRAEHRRHTIANGVDFGMLKHMKELEQEKDFLLQGLEMVERAREWYHQHIHFMQERQRLLGKNKTNSDFLPDGSQSHLGRLIPKLQEVNRCLGDLLTAVGKPGDPSPALTRLFPAAPAASPASAGTQQAINMLKEQNRLLTKEVTDKSERITQLEQEKSALIKQLFEARARSNHEMSQLDSTFI
uniref:Suppressor APC domain containing 2 n=1 Tax=Coturnix japonica TaxID=93934 RepID=A0A8C2TYW7_COTJA